jgi:hydroxyacylglutathione hydrolase
MSDIIRIPCGNVNAFLIKEEDHAVLVDTGLAGYAEKIYDVCKDSHVECIILTHGHIDHIQNTAVLSKRLNVPIAIGIGDEDLVDDNTLQSMYGRGAIGKILCYFSQKAIKSNPIEKFKPTIFLKDGDSLECFGIRGKILGLPGHTKGSIGIDVDQRDLIVGDALMNFLKPTLSLLYENKMQLDLSAREISDLGNRFIHFGHGKSVQNRKWI